MVPALILFMGLAPTAGGEGNHIPVRSTDTYEGRSVNVLDFGAKGDGRTDDTEAIRAAVKAACERRMIPQHPQYGYFVSFAEVYFPSGHYIISDTIDITAVKIHGENYAALEQKNPEKDIFFTPDAWRQVIEGLTFLGGRIQLNLGNGNVDGGHVTVRDCHFKNSAGAAVQMRKGSNSTFFKVANCVVINCQQAVINHCDMAVISDCWISTSREMKNKAVIENHGVMHVENLLGVPRVRRGEEGFSLEWVDPQGTKRTASNQRWIDNYGAVHIKNSRFGGEGGGFSAIWNYTARGIVTLENCYVYNAQSAAIYFVEIPDVITVRNNSGFEDSFIFRVDGSLDLATYFDKRRTRIRIDEGQYRLDEVQLDGWAGGGIYGGLPEEMHPYIEGDIRMRHVPAKGRWRKGQFVRNAEFASSETPYGWLCIASGKPGKWQGLYYSGTPAKP